MQKSRTTRYPKPRTAVTTMDHMIPLGTVVSAALVSSANCAGASKPAVESNGEWVQLRSRISQQSHTSQSVCKQSTRTVPHAILLKLLYNAMHEE